MAYSSTVPLEFLVVSSTLYACDMDKMQIRCDVDSTNELFFLTCSPIISTAPHHVLVLCCVPRSGAECRDIRIEHLTKLLQYVPTHLNLRPMNTTRFTDTNVNLKGIAVCSTGCRNESFLCRRRDFYESTTSNNKQIRLSPTEIIQH